MMKLLPFLFILFITHTTYAASYPGTLDLPKPALTPLMIHGDEHKKLDIVIIGDGFTEGADQEEFNEIVSTRFMRLFKDKGAYWHAKDSFNIYRFNISSIDSKVSETATGNGCDKKKLEDRETVFNWVWCPGSSDQAKKMQESALKRLNNIRRDFFPWADKVIVVVNNNFWAGRTYGGLNTYAVTVKASSTGVIKHELGHMVSLLADEYDFWDDELDKNGNPTGIKLARQRNAKGTPNLLDSDSLIWKDFVHPRNSAIPTQYNSSTMDAIKTIGYFRNNDISNKPNNYKYPQGYKHIYRPNYHGVMNSNGGSLDYNSFFGPIGYKHTQEILSKYNSYTFDKAVAGDFSGDGKDDVVLHSGRTLYLYSSTGDNLKPIYVSDPVLEGNITWELRENDEIIVTNFNGDEFDDLIIINRKDWKKPYLALLESTGSGFKVSHRYDGNLPGWEISNNDEFNVGDFNADGNKDLLITNTEDWDEGYLGIFLSDQFKLTTSFRYDNKLPNWDKMLKNDKFLVADIDGDGKDNVIISNQKDWKFGYLGILKNEGNKLTMLKRYDETLLSWGTMKKNDQFYVADINGDGKSDISVSNCNDWKYCYFNSLLSTGRELNGTPLITSSFNNWQMGKNDQFYISDIDGDDKDDLVISNTKDREVPYIALLSSDGKGGFDGGWIKDRIGSWKLRENDKIIIANYSGNDNSDDILIRQKDWFATIKSTGRGLIQTSIHKNFIENFEYHIHDWW